MPRKLGRPRIPRGGFRVRVVDKDYVKPPSVRPKRKLLTAEEKAALLPRYKIRIKRTRMEKRIVLFDSWALAEQRKNRPSRAKEGKVVISVGKIREWIAEAGSGAENALREAAALCLELNEEKSELLTPETPKNPSRAALDGL